MARTIKSLLGGRYKLTGERARIASLQRAWDRWLERSVWIRLLPPEQIDGPANKRRFIDSAQALVRIDHPNVGAVLDYGVTDDGAPYHVLRDEGFELELLDGGRAWAWATVRELVLELLAAIEALHAEGIVHGEVGFDSVAQLGGAARLVDFGAASLAGDEATLADDLRQVAALGVRLLTGHDPRGCTRSAVAAALAQTDAPRRARAALLRASTAAVVELESLRHELVGEARTARERSRLISAAAALAAAAMLSIGLWSSFAYEAGRVDMAATSRASALVCEPPAPAQTSERAPSSGASPSTGAAQLESAARASLAPAMRFEFGRAQARVGAEAQRTPTLVRTEQFELRAELSPESLVERGIDLTHGRPTAEDDPRVPLVDGPARARALFEAACERDYGKGCHMLGVQIAEGMIPDDGAGPAEYYRRGCALDYHRSCAALADLARTGVIVADVSLLEAKACLLAGPGSSYCLPEPTTSQAARQ